MTTQHNKEIEELKKEFVEKFTVSDLYNAFKWREVPVIVWQWFESKLKAKDTALEKQREDKETLVQIATDYYRNWSRLLVGDKRRGLPTSREYKERLRKEFNLTPQKDE